MGKEGTIDKGHRFKRKSVKMFHKQSLPTSLFNEIVFITYNT